MRRQAFTLIELLVVIAIIAILAAILFPVFAKARDRAQVASCLSNTNQIGKGLMMYTDDNESTYPINRFLNSSSTPIAPYTWKRALTPYMKSIDVWKCPSNQAVLAAGSRLAGLATAPIGDESNLYAPYRTDKSSWLPSGFGYNGGFFHELSKGPYGPRKMTDVKNPAGTMIILESRTANPDLGPWVYNWRIYADGKTHGGSDPISTNNTPDQTKDGKVSVFFVHSNHRMNITFADGHAQSYTLPEVYQKNLWGVPDNNVDLANGRNYAWPSDMR